MFIITHGSCNDDDIADLCIGIVRDENNKVMTFPTEDAANQYLVDVEIPKMMTEFNESKIKKWGPKKDPQGVLYYNACIDECLWFEYRIEEL